MISSSEAEILCNTFAEMVRQREDGPDSLSPFCGVLERSIRDMDTSLKPVPPWSPAKLAELRALSAKHEQTHQHLVLWLTYIFCLSAAVETRVDERFADYKKTEPNTTRTERYPSAREWVINRYIRSMQPAMFRVLAKAFHT